MIDSGATRSTLASLVASHRDKLGHAQFVFATAWNDASLSRSHLRRLSRVAA